MSGLMGGGGGGGAGPVLDKSAFDLSKAVQKYGGMSDEQIAAAKQRQAFNAQAQQQLVGQLQGQAMGTAPSLAQAELKANQDRGLAQTMALAASQRGGNPALQARNLAMQQAAAGRANAQQGAILGLQERQAAQQQIGNLATAGQGQADTLASGSISQGFGQEDAAKKLMGQYETQRFNQDVAQTNANRSQQNAILGSVLGAAGTVAGAYFGGPAGAAAGGSIGKGLAGGGKFDGGMIHGEEVVKGDHPANDIIDIKASPGELVIPKTVVKAGVHAIQSFAEAVMKSGVEPKEVSLSSALNAKKKMYDGGRVGMPDPEKARQAWQGAQEGVSLSDAWQNLKNTVGAGDFKPTTSMPKDPNKKGR